MKFLHTADLQLGMKQHFVTGDNGIRLRAQRFDTLRQLAEVAHRHRVQAVVIAGDFFDDNGVGPDTLQQARDALATFEPVPVFILPGNHDAATEHSALRRLRAGTHVRILDSREPVELDDAVWFPCPLLRRHTLEDPTAWLPTRESGDSRIRLAMAHGGVIEFSESAETPNLIDAAAVISKGFDYLALGDWHGLFRYSERVWYPGTPEPTHWREKQPGHALVVSIAAAGAVPEVEPVVVGRSRWRRREVRFDRDQEVAELGLWLEQLDEKSWTAVQLALSGHLSLRARNELDQLLDDFAGRFLCFRIAGDDVLAAPTDDDLQSMAADGFVGAAVETLRSDPSQAARDALRLLYRFRVAGENGR